MWRVMQIEEDLIHLAWPSAQPQCMNDILRVRDVILHSCHICLSVISHYIIYFVLHICLICPSLKSH